MYNAKLDTRIQEEQLKILVQNLPLSLLSTIAVSSLLFYSVIDKVPTASALIWISLILLLSFIRIAHTYKLKTHYQGNYLKQERNIVLGIFLSGVLFGSSVVFLFPPNDLGLQALIYFLLSLMLAGAVSVYSTHLISYLLYTLPIVSAFLYQVLISPENLMITVALGLTYYFISFTSLLRMNKSITKLLKNKYLNHDLADSLSNAKEDLQNSNNELKLENSVRQETERRLYHLANFDPLTGLANRHKFKEDLKKSLVTSKKKKTQIALLFLDLDNFKIINDTLGHAMGDKLLIATSSRLKSLLNDKNSISRLGGDEFVIILNDFTDKNAISKLARSIITLLEKPFNFDEHEMFIGTSIGISLYPDDANDKETLLAHADTAMYAAKDKGKNNYQFFNAKMYKKMQFHHDIQTKLHHAIANNEFRIQYQPKINIKTNEVIGAEALLRWYQKDLGKISPSVFIPIAEESNLINDIGKWVISKVCEDLAHLKNNFNNDIRISLNVSSSQILHQNLPQLISQNLEKHGLHSRNIELEFTENMLIKQAKKSSEVLQKLNKMGICLCIDDFGTGYSSLNYLKTLPIHTLKIDKSFIMDVPHCADDYAIAKSIISLAHNLQLNIIAEGVETLDQLSFLQDNGCSVIQGYYFSKPIDINAFSLYLNTSTKNTEIESIIQ